MRISNCVFNIIWVVTIKGTVQLDMQTAKKSSFMWKKKKHFAFSWFKFSLNCPEIADNCPKVANDCPFFYSLCLPGIVMKLSIIVPNISNGVSSFIWVITLQGTQRLEMQNRASFYLKKYILQSIKQHLPGIVLKLPMIVPQFPIVSPISFGLLH